MSSDTIAARKETIWVVCAGMYRSASTLQYQIASELVERTGAGYRLPWSSNEDFDAAINAHRARPGMKILKSHVASPRQTREFRRIPTKVLYSYRDLRDVAASIQRKWHSKYTTLGLLAILDEALTQHADWTKHDWVLVQSYERLTGDLPGAIREAADFLEVTVTDELVDELAQDLALENQRLKTKAIRDHEVPQATHRDFIFSEKELLHHDHITDGRTGSYAQTLTPAQISAIEHAYGDWLREHGYSVPPRSLVDCITARATLVLYWFSSSLRRLRNAVK